MIEEIRKYQICNKFFVCGYIFLLSFLLLLKSPLNLWNPSGIPGTDSSVFKTVAMYIDQGLMPYTDVFDHKGPLIYFYNWIGMQIAYWRGIWIIELLSMFFTFGILYKTARLYCGRIFACLSLAIIWTNLVLYFEGGNLVEEYAMPFIALALYLFSDYLLNSRTTRLRLILCGGAFGAVVLLRANMIPVWIVFGVLILIKEWKEKQYKKLGGFVGWFFCGLTVMCLPFFLWLLYHGSFRDFLQSYIIFNLKYTSSGISIYDRYQAFSWFTDNVIFMMALACMFVVVKKYNSYITVGTTLSVLLTVFFICMSGRKYGHYAMILVPVLHLSFVILGRFIEKTEKSKVSAYFIIVFFLVICVIPQWHREIDGAVATYFNDTNKKADNTAISKKVAEVIRTNTTENDTISVWGNHTEIYLLSHRVSASRLIYQWPVCFTDSNLMEEYFNELEQNMPMIIVTCMESDPIEDFLDRYQYEVLEDFEEMTVYIRQ